MATTYKRCDDDVTQLVVDTIDRHHWVLRELGVTVDVLMAHNALGAVKCHGYPAAAAISITPTKQRALGCGDALMIIDEGKWEGLGAKECAALVDHELQHLCPQTDDIGNVKYDCLRRPKLELRLHDWQLGGFEAIVQRHREHALEVRAIRACLDEKTGQYSWDWKVPLKAVVG